jgi:hypothetical protein
MTHLARRLAWMVVLALAAIMVPQSANATVRALFVGVDDYEWSEVNQFANLTGAVGDVRRIKQALMARYNWSLDTPADGCRSQNDISITLTDKCAARDSIVAALKGLIARSHVGDTVLFYFAGHGSQLNNTDRTQKSGSNDTILPYDARDPTPGKPPNEIVDVELNAWIENARNQGVNVVTIFDSCHSKTATRDARTSMRWVERRVHEAMVVAKSVGRGSPMPRNMVEGTRAPDTIIPSRLGHRGYRVHFAAALDHELAAEVALVPGSTPVDTSSSDPVSKIGGRPGDDSAGKGKSAGTFTTALVAAIQDRKDDTFADLIANVQLSINDQTQHPQAEAQPSAALDGTFEGRTPAAPVFRAKRDGAAITLAAGKIAVVTERSTYALFADRQRALDSTAAPLATAKVTRVDFETSSLAPDVPAASLPDALFARELVHDYGVNQVRVAISLLDKDAALEGKLAAAIAPLKFAVLASDSTLHLQNDLSPDANRIFVVEHGQTLADLGIVDDHFAGRLATTLKAMARVQDILDLRAASAEPDLLLCIDDRLYTIEPLNCPVPTEAVNANGRPSLRSKQHVIPASNELRLTVKNNAGVPRYVYVLMIENRQDVTLLTPEDAPLREHHTQLVVFTVSNPGTKQFLVLASEKPIAAGLLEQDGARDAAGCSGPLGRLEQLLCTAGSGSARDPAIPHVASWAAIVKSLEIGAGK